MKQLIRLPHKVCDYSCPTNGMEDQYEWKTGQRLPDFILMYLSTIGFTYLKQKQAPAPRMVFWGSKMGKPQHEFLSDLVGYRWTCSEGGGFKTALAAVKSSVERGTPAILGLLDMYHLPYFNKFYHRVHIPQHYVLMVGYDDQREVIFAQDNSLPEVQEIPYSDLKEAWNVYNPGQGIKNTWYTLEFGQKIASLEEILDKGLRKRAEMVLNPPVGFMGISGMERFGKDFPRWAEELTPAGFEESLRHLATFTCSVIPMLPQSLLPFPLGTPDPHQACRDRFATLLAGFGEEYHQPGWVQAARCFKESGAGIQEITETAAGILLGKKIDPQTMTKLMEQIAAQEEEGYRHLLPG